MKNIYRLMSVLVCLISSGAAFALPGVSLGVVGGGNYNMSSFPSVSEDGFTSSVSGGLGYTLGISADLPMITASVLFSRLSAKATVSGGGLSLSQSSTYKIIQVPVHYSIGLGGVSVGVGGFMDYSLEDDQGSNANYGLSAGARMGLPMSGLFAQGLFNYGLKDMDGAKQHTALVLIGYNFL
jgi:hypothetical protein